MIKVLHDKVLLEEIDVAKETDSGLIIPDNAKSMKEPIAYVIGVGTHEDISVEVGDKVAFDPGALMQLTVEGNTYMLLPYRSIIAVLGNRKNKAILQDGL